MFKNFLQEFEESYPGQRTSESLLPPFQIEHALWDKVDEWFLHFLDSQSCYEQVEEGKVKIGAVAIAPTERMFSSKKGLGGNLLNDRVVTRPVDPQYLQAVRQGDISYYHLFLKELALYKKLRDGGKINMLSRKKKATTDGKALPSYVLGMEGGHALSRTKIGKPGMPDTAYGDSNTKADALYEDFRNNLNKPLYPDESLQHLQQALWDEGLDLCYLILTHLSHIPHQHLATHAYGMKFLNDEAKYPIGFGISEAGKRVVEKAYTLKINVDGKKVDAPVLIDIKHLSLKSREDLYAYRKAHNIKLPLIASHMGVTGYTIEEWKEALRNAEKGKASVPVIKVKTERKTAGQWGRTNKTFTYNPWTINMMDEDIIAVLESDGLIGVSLDVRILGVESQLAKITGAISSGSAYEYLSPEEFRYYFPRIAIRGLAREAYYDDGELEEGLQVTESYTFPNKTERHPLALCFNILHIVATGKIYTDKDPWKHICIGSDFDGLIDPLKNCRDAGKFPQLEKELLRWLPIAAQAYEEENGVSNLLGDTKLEILVKDLMSNNGSRFLKDLGY